MKNLFPRLRLRVNLMRWLPLIIVASTLVGCGSPSSIQSETATNASGVPDPECLLPAGEHAIDDTWPPTTFIASIGGHFGHSFKVELDEDGNLVYQFNPDGFIESGGTSEKLMVTENMWIEFRDRLNDAEVWRWRRRYHDPKIADGTVWKLEIKYYNQTITSSGSNAYPAQQQFDIFLDAVSNLANRKPFE